MTIHVIKKSEPVKKEKKPREKKDPAVPNWKELARLLPGNPPPSPMITEKVPVDLIRAVVLKYMATKKRWKDPKFQTEPDFLLVKQILDWCDKYGK